MGPRPVMFPGMRVWLVLVAHLIVTIIKVAAPSGLRAVVAESLLLKHQLLILKPRREAAGAPSTCCRASSGAMSAALTTPSATAAPTAAPRTSMARRARTLCGVSREHIGEVLLRGEESGLAALLDPAGIERMTKRMQTYYQERVRAMQTRASEAPKDLQELTARLERLRAKLRKGGPGRPDGG